jgi:multimeric flavodoxin WrbA
MGNGNANDHHDAREARMKAVAVNGSVRKDGNTAILLNHVLAELAKEGIETSMVQLGGKRVGGCIACRKCFDNRDRLCAVRNDAANEAIAAMADADAVVLGSPVYFADVSAGMKGLIERAGMVGIANGAMFRRKVGAGVVAVRRGGAIHSFHSLNNFFFISQMVVPGSSYWNVGIGREAGEVEGDEEGVRTMRVLGENMAWLLGRIHR